MALSLASFPEADDGFDVPGEVKVICPLLRVLSV
jgi:hypothetical protein